ncbi:cytochrome P450 [Marasmius fiardii PR-910]|nr:cytochrome P450 [Marasmius fiardii PR-910]
MPNSLELRASVGVLSCVFVAWLVSRIRKIGAREHYLPPGPPTTLLLGNVHKFPTVWPWIKLAEWATEYGEIYSLKLGPATVVIITGVDAVKDLMDERGAATSDRPKNWMIDAVTDGLNMAGARYSSKWRAMRKAAHAILSPSIIEDHLPIQRAEAMQVLHDFLETPEGFFEHIQRYSNSVIMSVIFGKRCPRFDSYETKAFYEVQRLWNDAIVPGAYPPIELFPVLDYIPERWAPWKRMAQKVRRKQRGLYFMLLNECEKRIMKGEENGCFMEEVLARQEELQLTRDMIGHLGGVLLEGGSDTTATFLQSLILFITAHPDAQKKAQKEIDAVVGHDRLPSLDNMPDLPYIRALIKEVHKTNPMARLTVTPHFQTHRFHPVTPLLPHASLTTEEYRRYIIPKETTILVNIYGIFHSTEYFEDPETFNPDRFLLNEYGTKPGVDTTNFRSNFQFGCGRRICPGSDLANNSLMLNTMNLLWAFDFRPPQDSRGRDLPVDIHNYERGIVSAPRPFDCQIKPRNDRVVEIIEREFMNATETFSKFERGSTAEDRTMY